jgi:hypothetical protein
MKNGIHSVILYLLITAAASTPCVYAAGTTLLNIREGLHTGYSRLVLECEGNLRYYDYDNRTKQIDFSSGYVETDASLNTTAITTLPTSYAKTQAGLDLGFDVRMD